MVPVALPRVPGDMVVLIEPSIFICPGFRFLLYQGVWQGFTSMGCAARFVDRLSAFVFTYLSPLTNPDKIKTGILNTYRHIQRVTAASVRFPLSVY